VDESSLKVNYIYIYILPLIQGNPNSSGSQFEVAYWVYWQN